MIILVSDWVADQASLGVMKYRELCSIFAACIADSNFSKVVRWMPLDAIVVDA